MYGVKYKVPFKTISDRDSVVILEEKGYTGSVIELIAGGTPFIIDTDQSDLLTPIRSSTATLAVVGSDYLQDLYANDPQGIRVTCEVDGEVKWLGYLLPDTFSQDFTHPEFVYEMECVDALSVLKHVEFDIEEGFISFYSIIRNAQRHAGLGSIFLSNSVRVSGLDSFFDLEIASANFYDELGQAMTYYDVLEEIAKYAGCVFTTYRGDLYLLDYAAIRMGFNTYETHQILGNKRVFVQLSDNKTVTDYKGTGTKLSRIAGKNKATVNCSLYEIDNILPQFDNEGSVPFSIVGIDHMQRFEETFKVGKSTQKWIGLVRYYSQPKYTFYAYHSYTGTPTETDGAPNLLGSIGSLFVRTTEFEEENTPAKLNMSDEVQVKMFLNNSNQHLRGSKILSIKSERQSIFHKDVWFCVNMQFKLTKDIWNKQFNEMELLLSNDITLYLKVGFRIGEYFYNGSVWTTTPSTFTVPVSYKKGEKILNIYKGVDDKNTYDKGLGDLSGFIFKAPDFSVIGDCELTIYTPDSTEFSGLIAGGGMVAPMQYMYYKDISFSYGIPDESSIYSDYMDSSDKKDVIYENEIGDYIEEADDIDLKICTNVDKKLAYSSVLKNKDFLNEIITDTYGSGVAETILVKRIVGLFSKPRFVIDPVLENNAKPYTIFTEPHLNKKFMNAGGEEDVKMESTRYNLIEI